MCKNKFIISSLMLFLPRLYSFEFSSDLVKMHEEKTHLQNNVRIHSGPYVFCSDEAWIYYSKDRIQHIELPKASFLTIDQSTSLTAQKISFDPENKLIELENPLLQSAKDDRLTLAFKTCRITYEHLEQKETYSFFFSGIEYAFIDEYTVKSPSLTLSFDDTHNMWHLSSPEGISLSSEKTHLVTNNLDIDPDSHQVATKKISCFFGNQGSFELTKVHLDPKTHILSGATASFTFPPFTGTLEGDIIFLAKQHSVIGEGIFTGMCDGMRLSSKGLAFFHTDRLELVHYALTNFTAWIDSWKLFAKKCIYDVASSKFSFQNHTQLEKDRIQIALDNATYFPLEKRFHFYQTNPLDHLQISHDKIRAKMQTNRIDIDHQNHQISISSEDDVDINIDTNFETPKWKEMSEWIKQAN